MIIRGVIFSVPAFKILEYQLVRIHFESKILTNGMEFLSLENLLAIWHLTSILNSLEDFKWLWKWK